MQPTRPVVTVRPVPAMPMPLWEAHRLFVEAQYADGQPYDQPATDSEIEPEDVHSSAAA